MESKNQKDKKKNNAGCFIFTFLLIASGIPLALKNESNVRFLGVIPIIILGLVIAYYVAKSLNNN